MSYAYEIKCLDHGHVRLLNMSGPVRRSTKLFDADDTDPALAARLSFNKFTELDDGSVVELSRPRADDLKLCDYLMKNWHTSPFEMIETWWDVKLPIFVARQIVRHRTASLNEVSGRYVELPAEWYIPDLDKIGHRGENMKQGRIIDGTSTAFAVAFQKDLSKQCSVSYELYCHHIAHGIPPEVARLLLHVNHYTHWVWKIDLHNLMHFLALRVDTHAQYEARVYGEAKVKVLEQLLPNCMELFHKYRTMR